MDHKCSERCLNSACKIKKLCCYSYAKQLGSGKLPTKRACINNKVHKCSGGILIRPCNVTAIGINNELGGVWVKDPAQLCKQHSQTTLIARKNYQQLIIGNKPMRLMTQHINVMQKRDPTIKKKL